VTLLSYYSTEKKTTIIELIKFLEEHFLEELGRYVSKLNLTKIIDRRYNPAKLIEGK